MKGIPQGSCIPSTRNGEVIINMAFLVVYHANTFMRVPGVPEPPTTVHMLIRLP